MHVPAYCPVEVGVQAMENSGVVDDVKNTMAISSMPIIVEPVPIGIDMPVDVPMAIPVVAVAGIDMDMDIESMFILTVDVACDP
jgi:hypothetical protein